MNPSVMIAIPSGSDWKADFGMCLAGLMVTLNRPLKGGGMIERIQLHNLKGSILSRSRHKLVENALAQECSHILFLDSDMTFPNYTLHQLLAAGKAIVAANCAVKQLPSNSTARRDNGKYGEAVLSSGNAGLEKVWRVGTGVMLIKTSVFADLPKPWFPITWNEEQQDYTGEDWNFCALAEKAGIPIWVDHTLSQQIGHIGSYTYQHTDIPPDVG